MECDKIIGLYDQPWRYHHARKHVDAMHERLRRLDFDKLDEDAFYYASIFHDAVYEPYASDNEEKSNELWLRHCEEKGVRHALKEKVSRLIMLTKNPLDASGTLEKEFIDADWNDMGNVHKIDDEYARWLDEYEKDIFREFQQVPVDEYVKGRRKFIFDSVKKGLMTEEVSHYLLPLVDRKKTVGIYAGSFFPFHVGHLNVLRKAERMFDKVIVAQGVNREKTYSGSFGNLAKVLRHHEIEMYSGQLVDYVNSKRSEYVEPVLVRGLRNGYDLNQETNLIRFVDEQADSRRIRRIPIAYISCDKEFEHVSSSAIRTLEPSDAERYVPDVQ